MSAAAGAVRQVRVDLFRASPRSKWITARVGAADGLEGCGEASLHVSEGEVRDALARMGERLAGLSTTEALRALPAAAEGDLVASSARCALDQALHDLEAQRRGLSIARLLAREPARRLEVYANINRRTRDRSPAGFSASARDAASAGFGAVKIAPFDGLAPDQDAAAAAPRIEAGLSRMAAVRDALGPDRRLLVDCHWRLSPAMLDPVAAACAELDVFWLETPYPEDDDRADDIRAARRVCNARGVRLAGGELKVGRRAFERLIEAACYDVLMPDMKYVGGYGEFVAVAEAAARAGVAISPHNPTGPVCHAHSVQASAAIAAFLILEMQFDETPAFAGIVAGDLPMPAAGVLDVPAAPGCGVRLIPERIAALEAA